MTSTRRVIFLLALGASVGVRGAAQTPVAVEHARRLIEAIGLPEMWRSTESTYVTSLLKLHPQLSQYDDVVGAWQLQVFTWDSVGAGAARRLATELSVPELDSLTRFYRSPLGRKWRGVARLLQRDMAETEAQLVHDHYPELRARLQARAQQLHRPDPLASD